MAFDCRRLLLILGLSSLICLVSSFPNSPRTNTHFSSGSFSSPNEDPALMGGVNRPFYPNAQGDPSYGTRDFRGSSTGGNRNDGGPNRVNNNFGNERGFSGLKDEWNNNYRSGRGENNNDGSYPNYNKRPQNYPNNPSFNRPVHTPSGGVGDGAPVGGSMPGIIPHRMASPNHHIRPPTPQNYFPISSPQDSNEPMDIGAAFPGCEKHGRSWQPGKPVNGHYETPMRPMEHKSHIAVYPLTDHNPELMVKIMMPSRQYQVTVQGTNVMLEKCDIHGIQCNIEDEKATKSRELIYPQKWNYIHSHLDSNSVTVGIGAEVEVMSMRDIPAEDLDNAEWLVMSGDGSVRGSDERPSSGGGNFVVEYPCAEYVATHLSSTPAPHPRTDKPSNANTPGYTPWVTDPSNKSTYIPSFTGAVGYTTEKPETDGADPSAALIVGVIGALVLLGLVIAIIVSVVKKKRSMAVTESTPLSEQKRSEPSDQQCEQNLDEQSQK